LPVELRQTIGRVVEVLGRIAVDHLFQSVPNRVIAVLVVFAGGVAGFGQAIQVVRSCTGSFRRRCSRLRSGGRGWRKCRRWDAPRIQSGWS
jgi:hypothetical protein